MAGNKKIVMCLLAGFIAFAHGLGRGQEPVKPGVDRTFSAAQEQSIDQLTALAIPDVFKRLTSDEFLDEEAYLNKAIYMAFNRRVAQAVEFALGHVRSTEPQQNPTSPEELYIAKKTLQIFQDQALKSLLDLYSSGKPKTRKNVIEALGQMEGESAREVLIDALDDPSFCEDQQPESVGEPLRICDAAYNQLVIRYKIKNVPRVIGSVHTIDMRNHHIRILKDKLAAER